MRVTLAADRKAVDPVVEQVMEAIRETKCVDGKEDAIELVAAGSLGQCRGSRRQGRSHARSSNAWWRATSSAASSSSCAIPGEGFDPKAIPSCTMGENLYSNHGRGIFLINQLMDEVQFRKNGTEIHMVKR